MNRPKSGSNDASPCPVGSEGFWEDLAIEFMKIQVPGEPLRAEWQANEGAEAYRIWLLVPNVPEYSESIEPFRFSATRAVERAGLVPISTPKPLEHDPQIREKIGYTTGDSSQTPPA